MSLGAKVTIVSALGVGLMKPPVSRRVRGVEYIEAGWLSPLVWRLFARAPLVQFEFPFLPPLMFLARALGKKVILDQHGIEFKFRSNMSLLRGFQAGERNSISQLGRRVLRNSDLVYFLERTSLTLAHRILVVSEEELRDFARIYGVAPNRMVALPIYEPFSPGVSSGPVPLPERYVIFVGSFLHEPNAYGALITLDRIVPLVVNSCNVSFVFVGHKPPDWLRNRDDGRTVLIKGDVQDVTPYIRGALIAICPIWHGSGIRVKLLHYMREGKPVISTPKGAEGLAVSDGINVMISNTPEEFANSIKRLLDDNELMKKLETGARDFAARYSWQSVGDQLLRIYSPD